MEQKATLSNWKLVFSLAAVGCGSLICILVITVIASKIAVFIQPDERAVVVSPYEANGLRKEALAPGLHLLKPFERAVIYNTGEQTYMLTSKQIFTETKNLSFDSALPVRSHDGLGFSLGLVAAYRIDPDKVIDLYLFCTEHCSETLVRPQIRSITRDTILKYDAADLTTQRPKIERDIYQQVKTVFADNDLVLLDIHILYLETAP